jgi:hypothetical protein
MKLIAVKKEKAGGGYGKAGLLKDCQILLEIENPDNRHQKRSYLDKYLGIARGCQGDAGGKSEIIASYGKTCDYSKYRGIFKYFKILRAMKQIITGQKHKRKSKPEPDYRIPAETLKGVFKHNGKYSPEESRYAYHQYAFGMIRHQISYSGYNNYV